MFARSVKKTNRPKLLALCNREQSEVIHLQKKLKKQQIEEKASKKAPNANAKTKSRNEANEKLIRS